MTRATLCARGDIEVEVCRSGQEALAIAPLFALDLILLDVMTRARFHHALGRASIDLAYASQPLTPI